MNLISFSSKLRSALFERLLYKALSNKFLQQVILGFCKLISFGSKDLKVFSLIWLDEFSDSRSTLVRAGCKTLAYSPHFFGRPQTSVAVNLPDIRCYKFSNAVVSARSSSVIIDDEYIVIERAQVPDQEQHNYACGHIRIHDQSKAIVNLKPICRLNYGIFLGGNGSWNYYHWMLELLTKIEFLSKLPSFDKGCKILVSEDVILTPSLKKTLDIFINSQSVNVDLIILKNEINYLVKELFYINSTSSLPFSLRGESKFKCEYSSIDERSIIFLRETVLKSLFEERGVVGGDEKIFLCRKNIRRNYNQNDVANLLHRYGFKSVFIEDYDFLEQVRIIKEAKFIVGPTGAAWTNLIFASAGSKALCWMADKANDFSVYSNMAKIVGVDLRYITYLSDVRASGDLYSEDYFIEPIEIESGLKALGLQPR